MTTNPTDTTTTDGSSVAADLLAAQSSRRSRRKDIQQGVEAANEASPISEAAVLGIAEPFTVGAPKNPLLINLRAPVISEGKKVYSAIMRTFPDVIIGASVVDPNGKGIDLDAVVDFWNANKIYDEEATRKDMEQEICALGDALLNYDPALSREEQPGHILDSIADVTWALAAGFNENIERDKLPALLQGHLRPVDFADLLRAILRACRGCDTSYESDIFDRFGRA